MMLDLNDTASVYVSPAVDDHDTQGGGDKKKIST